MRKQWLTGLVLALATVAGAANAASFDARRAGDMASVISAHGASGQLKKGSDNKVYYQGQVGNIFFDAHFQTCDDARTYCRTMMLAGSWDSKKISIDQINRWNRWTLYCPAYIDGDNSPNMWYSISLSSATTEADISGDLSTWMDCLHDFDSFVGGPEAFLKSHS